MKNDSGRDGSAPIVFGALALTLCLLGLFTVLLSIGKLPEGCSVGRWPLDRLGCLEPNALGDTFAGAFAPVAFVWLVAAVLLQRKELAAQRDELRQSREIAGQQFEESKKNVEYIRQQTQMMADEHNDAEMRADVRSLLGDIVDASRSFEMMIKKLEIHHVLEKLSPFKRSDNANLEKQLVEYIEQIVAFSTEAFARHGDNGPVEFSSSEPLNDFKDALQRLSENFERVQLSSRFPFVTPKKLMSGIKAVDILLGLDEIPEDVE